MDLKLTFAKGVLITTAAVVQAGIPGPGYDIEMSRMIPMRDAVELEAWITKPSPISGLGQPDIRRARFRNGFFKEQPLKAGQVVEISV